jgi:hypothetical protein
MNMAVFWVVAPCSLVEELRMDMKLLPENLNITDKLRDIDIDGRIIHSIFRI